MPTAPPNLGNILHLLRSRETKILIVFNRARTSSAMVVQQGLFGWVLLLPALMGEQFSVEPPGHLIYMSASLR
jgi:hypothetical protein